MVWQNRLLDCSKQAVTKVSMGPWVMNSEVEDFFSVESAVQVYLGNSHC